VPIPVTGRSKARVYGRSLAVIADWKLTIPLAARSKALACGRSLAGIAGAFPAGDMDVCSVLCSKTKEQDMKSRQRNNYGKSTKREQEKDFGGPGGGGGESRRDHECLSLVSVFCCYVETSELGRSHFHCVFPTNLSSEEALARVELLREGRKTSQ
jgi:hypothetical protein